MNQTLKNNKETHIYCAAGLLVVKKCLKGISFFFEAYIFYVKYIYNSCIVDQLLVNQALLWSLIWELHVFLKIFNCFV